MMRKPIQSVFYILILLLVLEMGCVVAPVLAPSSPTDVTTSETSLSDRFEFFDVTIDQTNKDTVDISFGYQIEKGLDTSGLQIMAQPQKEDSIVSCSIKEFTTNSKPYIFKEGDNDLVKRDNVTSLSMATPARCRFKGFTLMVFRLEGSNPVVFYEQDFEIPFDLEK